MRCISLWCACTKLAQVCALKRNKLIPQRSPYYRKTLIIDREVRIIEVRLYYVFDYWRVWAINKLFPYLIQYRTRGLHQFFYRRVSLNLYIYKRRFSSANISHRYICRDTYSPSEEPLVMLLRLFSRFSYTLLLILSSHHSAKNREEYTLFQNGGQ